MILSSCGNYLDIKPYGKTIPETPEEFSALLHTHLNDFDEGDEVLFGDYNTAVDLECISDNLEASLTKYPGGSYIHLYAGDIENNRQSLYENIYSIIKDCNIVIGYIEKDDTQLCSDVLGTAYAMRGLCYFNLLRGWCEPCVGNMDGLGVPLVTEFDMEAEPVRSTIRETAAQIESDYKTAISYDIQDDVYRFNNDVLKALLARLYFWIGDWEQSMTYADAVLEKYPLVTGSEYTDMIGSHFSKNGEMIFRGGTLSSTGEEQDYAGVNSYLKYRPVSKRFIDTFTDGDRDVRYSISFTSKREASRGIFICVRSSEMQLIKAECLYHEGKESEALSALNEFRKMRITSGYTDHTMSTLPAVNADEHIQQDAEGKPLTPLINAILNERRKEFFLEGDRWYELKRNGRPEFWVAKQGRKYTTYQFMYTFPLPIRDVEIVDGLIQNPGYERTM